MRDSRPPTSPFRCLSSMYFFYIITIVIAIIRENTITYRLVDSSVALEFRYLSLNCKCIPCNAFLSRGTRAYRDVYFWHLPCDIRTEIPFYPCFFSQYVLKSARARSLFFFLRGVKSRNIQMPVIAVAISGACSCQRFGAWRCLISYHGNVAKWSRA